jgi:uncharacterized protein
VGRQHFADQTSRHTLRERYTHESKTVEAAPSLTAHPRDTARAMSRENVEIVRDHMEAFLSGDREKALSYYDPEVEFDATARPEGQVYRGHEGVAEAMRVWIGAWEDWKLEVEEIIDAGDRVLVIARESGRGKGSGIEIDQQSFVVFTLRQGKIVRWQGLVHRATAFEAAGLRE